MNDILKLNYPEAEIDFMVNKKISELIEHIPNITNIIGIEKVRLNEIKNICKTNKYDIAILVKPEFMIALALFLSGIKYRLGSAYRWYSFLFNLKHKQHRKYSVKHEAEYNTDLLDELNCKRTGKSKPVLTVEQENDEKIQQRFKELSLNNSNKKIIIHITTGGSALTWRTENFIELVNLLSHKGEYTILLTCSSEDKKIINSFYQKLDKTDNVYIFTNMNLKEFAALIKSSDLFVSNSTGPIHIAAAVGCFCIGFYSPRITESAVRWAPITEKKYIFELSETENNIQPEKVFNFITNLLSKQT